MILLPAVLLLFQAVISVHIELVAVPVTVTDALLALARRCQAVVCVMGLLGTSPAEEEEDAGLLKRLCKDTGGIVHFPRSAADILAASTHVARDLREQYTLGFAPGARTDGRAFRNIELSV